MERLHKPLKNIRKPSTAQTKQASLGDLERVRQRNGDVIHFLRESYKNDPNRHKWTQYWIEKWSG